MCLALRLNLALEKQSAVDVTGDRVMTEMTEGTRHDLSSSSTRTLPPVPGGCHGRTTETNEVSGMTSVEPQGDSGIALNTSPSEAEAATYSRLRSSTREPPPPPRVYEELIKPDYYNIKR